MGLRAVGTRHGARHITELIRVQAIPGNQGDGGLTLGHGIGASISPTLFTL